MSASSGDRPRPAWALPTLIAAVAVVVVAVVALLVGRADDGPAAAASSPAGSPSASAPSAPTGSTEPTPSVRPEQPADVPTRLAWFYKPPRGAADEETVLSQFDTFVLTRGDEELRDRVRSERPGTPVLQYFLLSQVVEPQGGNPEQRNNAAYLPGDFAQLRAEHPDWFLRTTSGDLVVEGGKYYRMDPGSPEWRSFFLERVLAANDGWDGLFLDNADLSLCGFQDQGIKVAGYADDAAYVRAVRGFLRQVNEAYHETTGKPVVVNMVNECDDPGARRALYPYVQGVMTERFAVGWGRDYLAPDEWARQMARVRDEVAAGLDVVLVSQGPERDAARQRFAFASYLLVAAPNVSFRYAWARLDDGYAQPWTYDDYDLRLGSPRGPAKAAGGVWTRVFDNGTVTVDPRTRTARIAVAP